MSATAVQELPHPARTLCLGDALVDLICERPIEDLSQAGAFVPRFGGAGVRALGRA